MVEEVSTVLLLLLFFNYFFYFFSDTAVRHVECHSIQPVELAGTQGGHQEVCAIIILLRK